MQIKVFNPVAERVKLRLKTAPRIKTLRNKTLGLVWNGKGGGDILLKRVASNITKELGYEFHVKEFKDDFPFSPYTIEKITATCTGVIGSTGD